MSLPARAPGEGAKGGTLLTTSGRVMLILEARRLVSLIGLVVSRVAAEHPKTWEWHTARRWRQHNKLGRAASTGSRRPSKTLVLHSCREIDLALAVPDRGPGQSSEG